MSQVQPLSTTDQANQIIKTEQFREYIEREVLDVIKSLLDKPDIDQNRIQEIAKHTLQLLALGTAIDELYKLAIKLDENYPELRPVVIKLMNEYEQKYNKRAVEQVSNLIKQGKYEDAQNVMLKVLEFKGA
jgi:hypothetical protein